MLPILQSGGFAAVQSPMNSDGADNYEPTKDFQRSDRFSSLVRDSGKDSKAEDMAEKKADEKADAKAADESDLEAKESHRQGEGDRDSERPDAKNAAFEGSEVIDFAKNKSAGPKLLTNVELNHLLPQTSLAVRTENGGPIFEATTKLTEADPGMNVVPRQAGLNMEVELGHPSVPKGTIVAKMGVQQKAQVAVSVAEAAVQPALVDMLDLPSDPARQDAGDPRMRATSSTLQSVLGNPADVDTEFRSATGVSDEARSTQRVQVEAALTSAKSSVGEKPNSSLGSERLITTTQSQSTPLATPPTLMTEPPQVPQAARSHGNSRIRSASDLVDLTAETEAPPTAKKPSVAGLTFAPFTANEAATLSQKVATTHGNDELLRAGLGVSTENIIQSTQSEAVPRSTQVHPNQLPRHIARQLAEVSQRMPDRPVEVSLNPEELGRVRMSISAHDTGITMSLLAERQETLDLMRRHIDQLTQEFHALGFGDVRFSFSQKDESTDDNADSMQDDLSANAHNPSAEAPVKLSLNPSVGLDLRL